MGNPLDQSLGELRSPGPAGGAPPAPRVVLGTGFCGAYTTFSAFTYETIRLVEEGAIRAAVCNVATTVVAGAAAAAAGLGIASL